MTRAVAPDQPPDWHYHVLSVPIGPKSIDGFERDAGGGQGYIVRDVPMLAVGTWSDSVGLTPLHYPAAVLRESAGRWADTSGWTRHARGGYRDITDKVAEVRNPRYSEDANAVVGDLYLHCLTQKSREVVDLIKNGLVRYVSVEHIAGERYNPETRRVEATSIQFNGFAFVNRGACEACRLAEAPKIDSKIDTNLEKKMDLIEISQKYAVFDAAIEELKTRVNALEEAAAAAVAKPADQQPSDTPPNPQLLLREAAAAAAPVGDAAAAIDALRVEVRALQARPQQVVAKKPVAVSLDTGTIDLAMKYPMVFDNRTREISLDGGV